MITGPVGYNLCSYSDAYTTASFSASTGDFTFNSIDFPTFSEQSIVFEITVNSGDSSETFQFSLTLGDPCAEATIIINPSIVASTLEYDVYTGN